METQVAIPNTKKGHESLRPRCHKLHAVAHQGTSKTALYSSMLNHYPKTSRSATAVVPNIYENPIDPAKAADSKQGL